MGGFIVFCQSVAAAPAQHIARHIARHVTWQAARGRRAVRHIVAHVPLRVAPSAPLAGVCRRVAIAALSIGAAVAVPLPHTHVARVAPPHGAAFDTAALPLDPGAATADPAPSNPVASNPVASNPVALDPAASKRPQEALPSLAQTPLQAPLQAPPVPVPEPASIVLVIVAVIAIIVLRRRGAR